MTIKELKEWMEHDNAEYGTQFNIKGAYGMWELWNDDMDRITYAVTTGDLYEAWVKNRFKEKWRTKDVSKEASMEDIEQIEAGNDEETMNGDIAVALYWYCLNNHGGQYSDEYSILSNILYVPSPIGDFAHESESVHMIYDEMVEGKVGLLEVVQWIGPSYFREGSYQSIIDNLMDKGEQKVVEKDASYMPNKEEAQRAIDKYKEQIDKHIKDMDIFFSRHPEINKEKYLKDQGTIDGYKRKIKKLENIINYNPEHDDASITASLKVAMGPESKKFTELSNMYAPIETDANQMIYKDMAQMTMYKNEEEAEKDYAKINQWIETNKRMPTLTEMKDMFWYKIPSRTSKGDITMEKKAGHETENVHPDVLKKWENYAMEKFNCSYEQCMPEERARVRIDTRSKSEKEFIKWMDKNFNLNASKDITMEKTADTKEEKVNMANVGKDDLSTESRMPDDKTMTKQVLDLYLLAKDVSGGKRAERIEKAFEKIAKLRSIKETTWEYDKEGYEEMEHPAETTMDDKEHKDEEKEHKQDDKKAEVKKVEEMHDDKIEEEKRKEKIKYIQDMGRIGAFIDKKAEENTPVSEYEIVDLGIESPDYFQGFGTSNTRFDNSVVGIGSSSLEALEDALDQIAQDGYDVSIIKRPYGFKDIPVENVEEGNELPFSLPLMYYYIGIRWN